MFVLPLPPVGTVLYRVVDRPRRFPRRLYTPAANIILLPRPSSPFSFATLPLPVPWNISSHLFPSCHLPWKRCLFSILRVPPSFSRGIIIAILVFLHTRSISRTRGKILIDLLDSYVRCWRWGNYHAMIIGKKFPSMQNEKREIDSSRRRGKIFNRLVERRSHLLAPSPPFFSSLSSTRSPLLNAYSTTAPRSTTHPVSSPYSTPSLTLRKSWPMALRPKGDTIVDPTNRRVTRITHACKNRRVYTRLFFFLLSLSLLFFYLFGWLVSSFFVDGDSLSL